MAEKEFPDDITPTDGLKVDIQHTSIRIDGFGGNHSVVFIQPETARNLAKHLLELAEKLEDKQND